MSAIDIVDFYVTGDFTEAVRREFSREAVQEVAASGWELQYYRGFRGYKFYCKRGDESFATGRDMVLSRLFLAALRECLTRDQERRVRIAHT